MILVSKSPRRKEIMTLAGYSFKVVVSDIHEDFPAGMKIEEIPVYLAEQKAESVKLLYPGELLVSADTIVVLDGNIIGKPKDENDAVRILSLLSGNKHTVISGVCVMKDEKKISFSDTSEVYFAKLTTEEIKYYVENYKPLDKAGAYGVQDWIGMMAIERIDGSFYNVMGLPIHKLYRNLKEFGL